MKTRNYLKKQNKCCDDNKNNFEALRAFGEKSFKKVVFYILPVLILILFSSLGAVLRINKADTIEGNEVAFLHTPVTAVSTKKSVITIPPSAVNINPFVPYREIGNDTSHDVPEFTLIEPPEMLNEGSDAARVMDTVVSGILYDKFSPSAILNIEGNDYLVKKGDTVNGYKIITIAEDAVSVKLGANVYKAGIGEILTEGTLNYNDVSNLNNKFGGENNEL